MPPKQLLFGVERWSNMFISKNGFSNDEILTSAADCSATAKRVRDRSKVDVFNSFRLFVL